MRSDCPKFWGITVTTQEKAEVHERAPLNEAEGDKNGARGFKTEERRLSGRDKHEQDSQPFVGGLTAAGSERS